jgi:hypothetical protein
MKMNMGHWWIYADGKTELLGGKPAPSYTLTITSHVDWVGYWGKFVHEVNIGFTVLVIILSFPIFTFICCQCCIACIMTTKSTNDLADCILASPDIVTLHL